MYHNMYKVLEVLTSGISGQSQRRYERLRNMYLNEYYTRVAEHAKTDFLDDTNVVGIVRA